MSLKYSDHREASVGRGAFGTKEALSLGWKLPFKWQSSARKKSSRIWRSPMYSEKDNLVILTMSREDYDYLLIALGIAIGHAMKEGARPDNCLRFVNRLNSGNPHYTPYQVEAHEKKS
jgi:hypothetical protein